MLAFVFPGQGSQYVGMGKTLSNRYDIAGKLFKQANEVLGLDIQSLCLDGPTEKLSRTIYLQPAVYTVNMAAYHAFVEEHERYADFLLGHSLGEYAALTCGAAFSFQDGLQLVQRRAEYMEQCAEQTPSMMTAIHQMNRGDLESLCGQLAQSGHIVEIACYNTPHQYVISGAAASMTRMLDHLDRMSVKYSVLKVNGAFHSKLMQNAADRFATDLRLADIQRPKSKVISNVTALPYENERDIIEQLTAQIVKPVRWLDSMNYILSHGTQCVIELGARPILSKMFEQLTNCPDIHFFNPEHNEQLREKLKGNEIDNTTMQHSREVIINCLAEAVSIRNQNWNMEQYENQVVIPIRKLKQMVYEMERKKIISHDQEVAEAIALLESVLLGKEVSQAEQQIVIDNVRRMSKQAALFA